MSEESSLRYLSFLVENRNEVVHEIAELSSIKQTSKSLQESLNDSVYFYKLQLEKSEIHKNQLYSSMNKLEETFSKRLTESYNNLLTKNQEIECLNQKITHISAQLDIEQKLRIEAQQNDLYIKSKLTETELQFACDLSKVIKEKQELCEIYLAEISKLNEKIRQFQEKPNENIDIKENTLLRIKGPSNSEIFFSVTDEDYTIDTSAKLVRLEENFSKLKAENFRLKESINDLLNELEINIPLLGLHKSNYEALLIKYNDATKDLEYLRNKLEKTKDSIKDSYSFQDSKLVNELNEKCSLLSKEIFSLMLENHKIITGENLLQTESKNPHNYQELIHENSELKLRLRKIEEEIKQKQNLLSFKDLEIKKLQDSISVLSKETQVLEIRNSFIEEIKSAFKVNGSNDYIYSTAKIENEENKVFINKYKELYERVTFENLSLINQQIQTSEMLAKALSENSELKTTISKLASEKSPAFKIPNIENFNPKTEVNLNVTDYLSEYEKKLSELIQDKKDSNDIISNLQKEIIFCRQRWSEEVTRLTSENNLLKIKFNSNEMDRLREELGKSRRRLREIKYLLEINEKELKDEKFLRAKAEHKLKKAREKNDVKLDKNPDALHKIIRLLQKSSINK